MDNSLQVFQSEQFGSVRTLDEDGKVYFCGADTTKSLGYKRPKDAIAAHCKGAVKRRTLTNGGMQELLFIPEGDLYRLITHSRLPAAEEFERWVFDEVLPTIRRTGAYSLHSGPDQMYQMVETLARCVDGLSQCVNGLSGRIAYLEQTNALPVPKRRLEPYPFSVTAQLLWRTLQELDCCGIGEVQISTKQLLRLANIGSKNTLLRARRELIDAGYITVHPGIKGNPSVYHFKAASGLALPQNI